MQMEELFVVVLPAGKDVDEPAKKVPSPSIISMEYVIFGCVHLESYLLFYHRLI